MDFIQTSLLGIVQGISELLPISSTAHMILLSVNFYHIQPSVLVLSFLQFATSISILIGFRDILFKNMFSKEKIQLYFKIVIASIPAVVVGLLLKDFVSHYLYTNIVIAISLMVWGVAMIVVENIKIKATIQSSTDISWTKAFIIGLAQSIAIIPGTSRSGSTTVVGVLLGVEKYTSIQFSFFLGLPIIIGSFLYDLYISRNNVETLLTPEMLIGFLIAAVVGIISLVALRKVSKKRFLTVFGMYRIVLGIIILVLFI